jgi:hypothetical protein
MTWNYRVIKKDGNLGIHGVYYDETGNIKSYDLEPNKPLGDDLDDLRNELELMLEALDKEVFDFDRLENDPF